MSIKVEFDKKAFAIADKQLAGLSSKSQREIMQKSINDTVREMHAEMKRQIPKFVDRPKAITLNSLYAQFANSKFLNGFIEFKARAGKKILKMHWLAPLVFGGKRSDKGLDKILRAFNILPAGYEAIPTKDIRTDGYGNVRGNYVSKMISFLKLDLSGTQNRNSKKPKRSKQQWFVARFNNTQKIRPGIYEYAEGGLGRRVKMVFMFRQVTYRKTFPFFETAQTFAAKYLPQRVMERFKDATK